MSTTIISKQLIRKGNLMQMPFLSPGEFGLATDEQRLFLGQEPIVGKLSTQNSDTTVAYVDFPTKYNGSNRNIDIDNNQLVVDDSNVVIDASYLGSYKIVVTDDQGVSTDVTAEFINTSSNGLFYFPHGLGRMPTQEGDTFTLYWNKEITSYVDDDAGQAGLKAVELTKQSPAGNDDLTNIIFHSDIRNKISLEYTLNIPDSAEFRSGTLDIFIQGDNFYTIKDSYDMNGTVLDVEFDIEPQNKEFILKYDTTYVGTMLFNYIEKSFETLKSL